MKLAYIKCPVCGYEYTPSQIFIPNALLGKTKEVLRDNQGNIEKVLGEEPDLSEYYYCDNCNTGFIVTANIKFNTKVESKIDFEHLYETRLK